MAEFDDKLNSLLSNPEAMDQIMKNGPIPHGKRRWDGAASPRRAALR